jgi:uncharacterized membrane protein
MDGTTAALVSAVFAASFVEFVEAFTIVLAMGVTRGWKSAIAGTIAALVALTAFTAVLGVAISTWLSESLLQLTIGTLLLIFGLQWLRKACLRASGFKALHDEQEEFAEQTEAARKAERTTYAGIDLFGFMVSLKGVFLEGVEVVFIVITFGLNADSIALASVGAAIGGAIVLAAGLALHRPLARVPENTIKFAVGLLLSTFGTFWAVEGLGWFAPDEASLSWPGGDVALPVLLGLWCALAFLTVRLLAPRGREVA